MLRRYRHILRIAALLAVMLLLTACSLTGETTPAPTSPPPTTAATPPLAPGQVRVGDVLARVAQSWGGVTNLRSTFTTTQTTAGNATPATTRQVVVEEVKPDRRRIVVRENGAVTDEQVAVAGVVYLRGGFVAGLVAPNVGSEAWVTVDPRAVPPDTPVGQQVAALLAPIAPPFQTVSAATSALPATPAGVVMVEGRPCQAFTFADGDTSGEGVIAYTLALDAEGRLCSLEQRADPVRNLTVFAYNLPDLAIVLPGEATPVSGTPEG